MRALLIAAALFAAAPAVAQAPAATRLTLADSAKAPARATIIDGARWSCEGAACTASGGTPRAIIASGWLSRTSAFPARRTASDGASRATPSTS